MREIPPELQPIVDRIPQGWFRSIDCSPGWTALLVELDQALAALDPSYEVHQVKEKFGGLRYYIESSEAGREHLPEMRRLVDEAERKSFVTCEETGKPGVLMRKKGSKFGWLRTLNPEAFGDEWEPVDGQT